MFFQELPGLSKFKFYPTNSLPLLSHIPVEELRNCAIAELRNLTGWRARGREGVS